ENSDRWKASDGERNPTAQIGLYRTIDMSARVQGPPKSTPHRGRWGFSTPSLGAILRRACPPRLYKYFAADRWRFFSDLHVRYSQLGVFNDPFEGRPEITSLSSKEDTLATLGRVLPEEIERAYAQLPKHVQAAISYKQVFL